MSHSAKSLLAPLIGMMAGIAALAPAGRSDFSGTFHDEHGRCIAFEGDFAFVTIPPAPTVQATYRICRDAVLIQSAGGELVFHRSGDVLVGGPFSMTFVRR